MLRSLFLILAFLITVPAIAVPAVAADSQPPIPAPLVLQMARGAQVYYMGRYEKLDGWALIRAGQPEFYYAPENSNALVMGLLFNDKGELITVDQFKSMDLTEKGGVIDMMQSKLQEKQQAADTTAPAPATTTAPAVPAAPAAPAAVPAPTPAVETPAAAPAPVAALPFAVPTPKNAEKLDGADQLVPDTPANRMFNEVKGGNGVLWGDASKPAFHAFVDPNCNHCQDFIKQVEPLVAANAVAVYFYPVGFDQQSRLQAAFAIAASDGAERLLKYAKGEADALPAPEKIDIGGVNANLTIMNHWNLNATPIIIYRAGKSGQVRIIRGRPLDLQATVIDLVGGN